VTHRLKTTLSSIADLEWDGSSLSIRKENYLSSAMRYGSLRMACRKNTVHAITQTKDGYVWIATEAVSLASTVLALLFSIKQNTPQLPSNYIRTLLEDRRGALWIGTAEGLIRMQEGTFTAIRYR